MVTEAVSDTDFRGVFANAPVSLWIEDYSGIREHFAVLRASGVTDITSHIASHPEIVEQVMREIRVVEVNDYTLELYRAKSRAELMEHLDLVFRQDARIHFGRELIDMWSGNLAYETEGINYALDGTPIDIHLRRRALPGHESSWTRVLVSIMDISAAKAADRALAASENHARGLFEHAPASLWLEDYSVLRQRLDGLRQQGVTNFSRYLREHPEFVTECMAAIRVLDVNRRTLELLRASSKDELLSRLGDVFRDEMASHFAEELVVMWDGERTYQRESVNYALTGEPIDIHLQWSVMPGFEADWSRVLVSLLDITARKRAEAYLKYLGTHDILTGLFNRAYFDETAHRLIAAGEDVISLVVGDLNGLKPTNDLYGHAAGDALIRRAGEVLTKACDAGDIAARIGGDEFAVLLLGKDERAAESYLSRVDDLIHVNSQFHQAVELSISMGAATGRAGRDFSDMFREADAKMYAQKRASRA